MTFKNTTRRQLILVPAVAEVKKFSALAKKINLQLD